MSWDGKGGECPGTGEGVSVECPKTGECPGTGEGVSVQRRVRG